MGSAPAVSAAAAAARVDQAVCATIAHPSRGPVEGVWTRDRRPKATQTSRRNTPLELTVQAALLTDNLSPAKIKYTTGAGFRNYCEIVSE
ncbi:hypothetical protein PGTUg99_031257 [Puccinia graminis f. sp. tritici]|uniref:Uncharacterized protein n=1 Tax=Puccinia graminis f. sp. tritici TaxID=56615 RepID=A0A5B0S1E5_PUCGR|nr:hypothetical protein PGTUg99_031257 [Puccinia graminis f. sp. tritici]